MEKERGDDEGEACCLYEVYIYREREVMRRCVLSLCGRERGVEEGEACRLYEVERERDVEERRTASMRWRER